MLVDARDLDHESEHEFEVCIIGAGAAGIALAVTLLDAGVRVVVLESGGETPDPETQGLYIGSSSGQPYSDLTITRLRYFGGSTNHWGGSCRPFAEIDFEAPPGGHEPGWPIERADLAPFYDEAGAMCGLRSRISELDAAAAADPKVPLPLDDREFEARYNEIVDGGRRSFAKRYRDELADSTDVTVHLWANVVDIMVDSSGTVVEGARVATLTGVRYTVRSTVVVLAAGGIENPRLLLSSKGAGPEGLGNRHDLVGRFFMEHPRFVAAHIVPADPSRDVEWYTAHNVGNSRFRGYAALRAERLRDLELTDVQLRLSPRYSAAFAAAIDGRDALALERLAEWASGDGSTTLGADLLRITADLTTFGDWFVPGGPVPVPLPNVLGRLMTGTSTEREALIPGLAGDVAASMWANTVSAPPVELIDVVARIAQVPNAASRITLTDAVDQLGMARTELNWQLSEIDRLSVVRAVELFGAELAAIGEGRLQLVFDEQSDWPIDLAGGSHHMGTTRMSADPEDGVVDASCQVHGVKNLFVAGSSVFATAPGATPTLTIVALALRLADHLVREVLA